MEEANDGDTNKGALMLVVCLPQTQWSWIDEGGGTQSGNGYYNAQLATSNKRARSELMIGRKEKFRCDTSNGRERSRSPPVW